MRQRAENFRVFTFSVFPNCVTVFSIYLSSAEELERKYGGKSLPGQILAYAFYVLLTVIFRVTFRDSSEDLLL